MADSKKKPEQTKAKEKTVVPGCSCISDPFADLPPEMRPQTRPTMGKLRQVTCPGCGLKYWTNRSTDLCKDCQKKGINIT
jgi:hypothetical protein